MVSEPFVRVADYGRAANLSSVHSDELAEGEVVVAAKRRPPGSNRLVRIGGSDLDRCATLTVDKQRREITLAC